MPAKKPLVIIGASAFGEVAYEYFTHDSEYEVVAFSVERPYVTKETLFDIPIVPFDELAERYPASRHTVFTALVYNRMNRIRARLYREAKTLGYSFATYVSSEAFVWRNVTVGENSFIFEGTSCSRSPRSATTSFSWSGNHIGHHSRIRDHCFLASHIVVSGFVDVGEYCFIGVNATIANNVTIGPSCLVGAGAIILKDAPPATVYGSVMTPPKPRDSLTYYGIVAGRVGGVAVQDVPADVSGENSVVRYEPALKPEWDRFVGGAKNATFLFLRDYMDYHAARFVDASRDALRPSRGELIALFPAHSDGDVIVEARG